MGVQPGGYHYVVAVARQEEDGLKVFVDGGCPEVVSSP
jgi:hypothetical protein